MADRFQPEMVERLALETARNLHYGMHGAIMAALRTLTPVDLSALVAAIAPDMALVPREPTEAMVNEALAAWFPEIDFKNYKIKENHYFRKDMKAALIASATAPKDRANG